MSEAATVRAGTTAGRWVIAATVLGSGMAFLDGTVVNVAMPAIAEDLDASVKELQWVLDAYLVTLSALLLLGGSLGDRYGRRRVFVAGLVGFAVTSVACGLAPSAELLVAARALQGVAGALLVPGSLAIISASFHPEDRGRAVGAWSGLAGVASAVGPFLGGGLIDAGSWRSVFWINVPIAVVAVAVTVRHVPETRAPGAGRPDVAGGVLVTVGVAAASYALIERAGTAAAVAAVACVAALTAFVAVERRSSHPMLPLSVFRSRQFTGANLTTFAVYGGLGGALFLVVLRLQISLDYSALEAGVSLLPFTVLLVALSSRIGQLAQRSGPRLPMTVGPVVAGAGLWLLGAVDAGDRYLDAVLPGVALFGLGMAITVAPLTAAVLASVDDDHAGVASGVNNAVARLAGLIAVAVLPAVAGIDEGGLGAGLDRGYSTALAISAAACVVGGAVAFALVRRGADVEPATTPAALHGCQDPCARRSADPRAA